MKTEVKLLCALMLSTFATMVATLPVQALTMSECSAK